MKKSLLFTGVAGLAAMFIMTGCSSVPPTGNLAEEVKKAEAVVAKARGLENHKKLDSKHVIPNILLEQSRVLYIGWAATATDSIGIRFGEADVISVSRDATDASNLTLWAKLREADKDAQAAEAAAKSLEKFIAESYKKNKTTSKKTDREMFETVVGKIAQEDYIVYKKTVAKGDASESDYKFQKKWLEIGKKNILRVNAEQKKLMEAAKKRMEAAEKDAEAAKRKLALILKYHGSKLSKPGIVIGVNILKKELGSSLPAAATNIAIPFLQKSLIDVLDKNMKEAAAEWPEVVTAFSEAVPEFQMPKFSMEGVNLFNIKGKMADYLASVEKSLKDWNEKAFGPYNYAFEVGGKRWDSFWEVKKWANEAQKTLDEVSGN